MNFGLQWPSWLHDAEFSTDNWEDYLKSISLPAAALLVVAFGFLIGLLVLILSAIFGIRAFSCLIVGAAVDPGNPDSPEDGVDAPVSTVMSCFLCFFWRSRDGRAKWASPRGRTILLVLKSSTLLIALFAAACGVYGIVSASASADELSNTVDDGSKYLSDALDYVQNLYDDVIAALQTLGQSSPDLEATLEDVLAEVEDIQSKYSDAEDVANSVLDTASISALGLFALGTIAPIFTVFGLAGKSRALFFSAMLLSALSVTLMSTVAAPLLFSGMAAQDSCRIVLKFDTDPSVRTLEDGTIDDFRRYTSGAMIKQAETLPQELDAALQPALTELSDLVNEVSRLVAACPETSGIVIPRIRPISFVPTIDPLRAVLSDPAFPTQACGTPIDQAQLLEQLAAAELLDNLTRSAMNDLQILTNGLVGLFRESICGAGEGKDATGPALSIEGVVLAFCALAHALLLFMLLGHSHTFCLPDALPSIPPPPVHASLRPSLRASAPLWPVTAYERSQHEQAPESRPLLVFEPAQNSAATSGGTFTIEPLPAASSSSSRSSRGPSAAAQSSDGHLQRHPKPDHNSLIFPSPTFWQQLRAWLALFVVIVFAAGAVLSLREVFDWFVVDSATVPREVVQQTVYAQKSTGMISTHWFDDGSNATFYGVKDQATGIQRQISSIRFHDATSGKNGFLYLDSTGYFSLIDMDNGATASLTYDITGPSVQLRYSTNLRTDTLGPFEATLLKQAAKQSASLIEVAEEAPKQSSDSELATVYVEASRCGSATDEVAAVSVRVDDTVYPAFASGDEPGTFVASVPLATGAIGAPSWLCGSAPGLDAACLAVRTSILSGAACPSGSTECWDALGALELACAAALVPPTISSCQVTASAEAEVAVVSAQVRFLGNASGQVLAVDSTPTLVDLRTISSDSPIVVSLC